MSALYEIHLLHEARKTLCSRLKKQLEIEIARLGLCSGQVRVEVNGSVPRAASDDPVSRVAVFLASGEKPSSKLSRRVGAWLKTGTLVIPLTTQKANFNSVVPKSLHAINALTCDSRRTPPRRVVVDILRRVGLAEQERGIFISYRRTESGGIAEQLWEALSKRGFKVFLDQYSIDRGVDFQKELTRALREKSMVLLLESAGIRDSEWVMHEVLYAMRHKLGLLSLCWEAVADDRNVRVAEVPAGYRTILKSEQLCETDEQTRLTEDRLATLLDEIERVHAQAMARRRKELLNGFLLDLENVTVDWRGLWRLSIRGKTNAYVEVTPRPVRPRNLYECKQNGGGVADSYVLHPGIDYSPDDRDYVEWIVNGNSVSAVHGREAQELAERLKR